ncbi:hypothetical protein Hanom_Chr11g01037231 [Helianthus anomalus]
MVLEKESWFVMPPETIQADDPLFVAARQDGKILVSSLWVITVLMSERQWIQPR